jgi:hypothetical protein
LVGAGEFHEHQASLDSHARVEDRIRNAEDTREDGFNVVWAIFTELADLAACEPKALR